MPIHKQTVVTVFATPVAPATAEDFRLRGDRLTIEAGTMMSTGSVTITGVDNDETDGNREVRVAGAAENELGIVPAPKRCRRTSWTMSSRRR